MAGFEHELGDELTSDDERTGKVISRSEHLLKGGRVGQSYRLVIRSAEWGDEQREWFRAEQLRRAE